jgi:hypothetical protein
LLSQIQARYDQEQPRLEIQRRLPGVRLAVTAIKPLAFSDQVPIPQKRLIESLLNLPRSTLEEEMARRTEAVDAVAAYRQFQVVGLGVSGPRYLVSYY